MQEEAALTFTPPSYTTVVIIVIIIVIKVINNIARVVITEIRWPNTTLDLVLRKRMLRQEEVWGGKTTKAIVVGNCIHLDSETRKSVFFFFN